MTKKKAANKALKDKKNKLNNKVEEKSSASVYADPVPSPEISRESATIQVLKDQLEQLKIKVDENMDLAMRAKAELENVRRRAERDIANAYKFNTEKMVNELLPIFDSLDQGLVSAKEGHGNVNSLIYGVEITLKMFMDSLSKFNVTVLDPINHKFDPSKHEAISIVKDPKHPANTIIHVVQKGYLVSDRVIRPARVVVTIES